MKRKEVNSTDSINSQHPFQLECVKLKNSIECVVRKLNPRKIILFGSRAQGEARKDSDIDLLLIFDQIPDRKTIFELSHALLEESGVYFQLIPMLLQTYEETKDIIGGCAYPATKYGVVVYERS